VRQALQLRADLLADVGVASTHKQRLHNAFDNGPVAGTRNLCGPATQMVVALTLREIVHENDTCCMARGR
jgi:hypothetical protein